MLKYMGEATGVNTIYHLDSRFNGIMDDKHLRSLNESFTHLGDETSKEAGRPLLGSPTVVITLCPSGSLGPAQWPTRQVCSCHPCFSTLLPFNGKFRTGGSVYIPWPRAFARPIVTHNLFCQRNSSTKSEPFNVRLKPAVMS